MKKFLLSTAVAVLSMIGFAFSGATVAGAQTIPACHDEMSPEAPPPNDEDNCDVVGDPDEGGNPSSGGFEPPLLPPQPPPSPLIL